MLFSNKFLTTEPLNITFGLKFFSTKLEINSQTNRLKVITKATFNGHHQQQK